MFTENYCLLLLLGLLGAGQCLTVARNVDVDSQSEPIVNLGYAKYHGTRLEAGVDQYLGMRYAKPPLGDLRFRAPQDPVRKCSIQDASSFGPICVGVGQASGGGLAEDCLFVNVFKPSDATEHSKLPVWIYIQGGGYANNANANYNGTDVISQSGNNLIFVNFNYRVGALGFLASEKVREDGDLNAGLLDQRKLLHWVQTHISKFGGDPDHVVLHGASAGGGSVSYHLTAYEGKKDNRLFSAAVPENPFWPTQRTVHEMEFQFERLLQDTTCASLECLRSVDIADFMAATNNSPFPGAAAASPPPLWYWLPVIDGDLVVDHMYNLFDQGRFIHVPLLVGDDTDEGSYFAYNAADTAEMKIFLKNNYPHLDVRQLDQVTQLYPLMTPVPAHAPYFPSTSAAYGDCTFTCAGNEMASAVARYYNPKRVWNYRYNVLDPDNIANGLGVPHTFETSAIFGVGYAGSAAPSYSTTNAGIIPITMRYFISFVISFDPNKFRDSSAPLWHPWGPGMGQRLRLQTNSTEMEPVPRGLAAKCAFWKSLSGTMEV